MRSLGYLIIFLGLLATSYAARDRSVGQSRPSYPDSTTSTKCECVLRYRCAENDGVEMPESSGSRCISNAYVCCTKSPPKPECGWQRHFSKRILGLGDNEAEFGEFPWMVAVIERQITTPTVSDYVSGGSLVHPRAVLTAAHQLTGKSSTTLVVRAGEWDTQSNSEPIRDQEKKVDVIVRHENFNALNLHNDFAILILNTPFELAPNVNVICLPQVSDIFDAQRCVATGWGKNNFDKTGRFQAVLQKVELPVVPHVYCEKFLRLTKLGVNFNLDPSFICAGGESGRDTCSGDGGSPLVCPLKNFPNRYVQAGIVAWGIGCGSDRTPGVYANVAKARGWIDRKLAQYDIDGSTYTI